MKIDIIKRCARCGGDHKNVNFKKFIRPANDYTHWAPCPNTGEPIMMWAGIDTAKPDK